MAPVDTEGAEELVLFTEATEFVRGIGAEKAYAAPATADADVEMEDAMDEPLAAAPAPEQERPAEEGKAEEEKGPGSGGGVFTGQSLGKVRSLAFASRPV